MRFIALVSGGKDSTFAVSEAVSQGHELVGLAHLASFSLSAALSHQDGSSGLFSIPGVSEEKDSWMYQSVGSELVPFLTIAFEQRMFWIDPVSGDDFDPEEDQYLQSFGANAFLSSDGRVDRDVVRMWRLLRSAKQSLSSSPPQALVSGAILSNYQRTRIEVVCRALGWICISPLWQRPQAQLLSLMGTSGGIDARMIKTACIGLDSSHLMMSLCPAKSQSGKHGGPSSSSSYHHSYAPPSSNLGVNLDRLEAQYGVNVCGEGGEYESFTLDAVAFPHFRLLPLSWDVVSSSTAEDPSEAPVSYVRFKKLAIAEKVGGSTFVPETSTSFLSSVLLPHDRACDWRVPEQASVASESDISALGSTLGTKPNSLSAFVAELVRIGKITLVSAFPVPSGTLPATGVDQPRPIARNPLIPPEADIGKLKVTGPHFRTSGALVGSKLSLLPSSGATWPASNFYIECSHHVYEDCRAEHMTLAKDISQATQAVMNAIGRKLFEEGLTFKNIYFASLTIPSMSFFGDMNPVYSSYFVPVNNPPSRVTVAQCPRHPHSSSSTSPSGEPIPPSIRVEFWGTFPQFIDNSLKPLLALSPNVFSNHNVLHVESYSEWAPACIGPYSQAHEVLGVDHLAGQIALIPSQMILFAPSSSITDPDELLRERTLGELKWALRHVVALVKARSCKGGKLVEPPNHLLFSSMFTSVPISLANKCIEALEKNGTAEEKEAIAFVLEGATLIRVDQLPRLAAVEIQTVMDNPESAMSSSQDSNLVPHLVPASEVEEAKKATCFAKHELPAGFTVFSRWNLSKSLAFAHTQHVIVSTSTKTNIEPSIIVQIAHNSLDSIAPLIGCSPVNSDKLSVNADLSSVHLYFEAGEVDNPEYFKLAHRSRTFHFTPYPAVEIGAPHRWIGALPPNHHVVAAVHSKWSLILDLDD